MNICGSNITKSIQGFVGVMHHFSILRERASAPIFRDDNLVNKSFFVAADACHQFRRRMVNAENNANPTRSMDVLSTADSLQSMYFDPILSIILSDPARNVLLCWPNKITWESKTMGAYVVITKLSYQFFAVSAWAEAKLGRFAKSTDGLCYELLW